MQNEYSAGGVVVRRFSGVWQFAAIRPCNRKRIWALPKGHIEEHETPEQAALREVREETGLRTQLDELLGEVSYSFNNKHGRVNKTVTFFLLLWQSGSVIPQPGEADDARWFNLEDANENLSYQGERELVLKAAEILASR